MTTTTLRAVDQLQGLMRWVGDGRPLTSNGHLRLADARHLVEHLHTGDQHRDVRSSVDLWLLQDLLSWAKTARLLRVAHRRLLPVKKNAGLADDPQRLGDALLKSLRDDCQRYLGRYTWRSYFQEDADLGLETLWQHLPSGAGAAVDVTEIVAAVWEALTEHDDYPPVGSELEQCRQLVRRDVSFLLARYADLGVLDLSSDEKQVNLTEFGDAWASDQFSPHTVELHIALDTVHDPKVWRRLRIPDYWTLDLVARAIEDVMGWEENRGHLFTFGRLVYADPYQWNVHRDERSATAARLLEVGQRFRFVYDPEEAHWRHTVTVERRLPEPDLSAGARCVGGAGNRPIEDCAGPHGFAQLKLLLADTGPRREEEIRQLLGYDLAEDSFNPGAFSTEAANQRLTGQSTGRVR